MGSVVGCKNPRKEKGAFPDCLTARLVNATSGLSSSCGLVLEGWAGWVFVSSCPQCSLTYTNLDAPTRARLLFACAVSQLQAAISAAFCFRKTPPSYEPWVAFGSVQSQPLCPRSCRDMGCSWHRE